MAALPSLAYINGKWVAATTGASYPVTNPATGDVIGHAPDMDGDDAKLAISAAHEAFRSWRKVTALERGRTLRKVHDLLLAHQAELARIITSENGKSLQEATSEVSFAATYFEFYSEEARRAYGDVIPTTVGTRRMLALKEPVGVVAAITPWNFPCAMLARKLGAAIAAGCTMVLRAAEDTPFTALKIAELAEKAGVPPGVFNVITSSRDKASVIGKTLCDDKRVRKITFTGSSQVGKILYAQAAETVKRISLELGGHASFIVFNSADLSKAVPAALIAKFRNSGQSCVGAQTFLVQEGVYETFVESLLTAIKNQIKIGNGLEPGVTNGPLINERGISKVERHVADALSKGAKLLLGGQRSNRLGPLFYEPTLLADVSKDALAMHEETFGPAAFVCKFKTEAEAIEMANATDRGLAGYFFSRDYSQVWRVAEALEVGMVGVNEGLISTVEGPFGGVKESGLGREGSKYGIDEYLETKYVCLGGLEQTAAD